MFDKPNKAMKTGPRTLPSSRYSYLTFGTLVGRPCRKLPFPALGAEAIDLL
ncbi:hypothetical protein NBRC3257_0687 [Gluconobacter thailandicus NBRC 3257]|uniref:Uncharacterized protein n=1 Tax=Gluconobacter thailandicus NBRC 3257 TaxID=1381097 RepID=A0ABQ0ITZ2_GLUTH|nr:hypothetical protein NBRC3257_0687 [Gluconobacter thailandicus NBRC 3257]